MNHDQLLAWCAGMVDGVGVIACTHEVGPTRKHVSIMLAVAAGEGQGIERFITAAGNGGASERSSSLFELGGYNAIHGFIEDLWPYLTQASRSEINAEFRRFKQLQAGLNTS